MQFTNEELGRLLQWFNIVELSEPAAVEGEDRDLAAKIAQAWGKPVESRAPKR